MLLKLDKKKKKYFLEIMLTLLKKFWCVCSSSRVFLLLELQLKILLALYRQLYFFSSAILLKKDVLIFMHNMEIKCYLDLFCVFFCYFKLCH